MNDFPPNLVALSSSRFSKRCAMAVRAAARQRRRCDETAAMVRRDSGATMATVRRDSGDDAAMAEALFSWSGGDAVARTRRRRRKLCDVRKLSRAHLPTSITDPPLLRTLSLFSSVHSSFPPFKTLVPPINRSR
ncbi:hypothetical protein LR48_Vigan04g076900 [Vigna angularis]|uniref:Uncharacterized protein n=1 Tax=Phaseolus angularis TaxID=3914 RepID=A0A0L9UCZ8_PHAAN|nr:hypothetical protein LR48_Vigan04g076900 [Vigna angularis]